MKITKEQKRAIQLQLDLLQRKIEIAYGNADSSRNSWILSDMMMNVSKIEHDIKQLEITC